MGQQASQHSAQRRYGTIETDQDSSENEDTVRLPREKLEKLNELLSEIMPQTKDNRQDVPLKARSIVCELEQAHNARGFVLFGLFFLTYAILHHVRIDWEFGHATLNVYDVALDHVGIEESEMFENLNTVSEVSAYLDERLPAVIEGIGSQCPLCLTGLTPVIKNLQDLDLHDFTCSDFDSEKGSWHYPARNCSAVDAAWAVAPTSLSAPCCTNATLVRASHALMELTEHEGVTNVSASAIHASFPEWHGDPSTYGEMALQYLINFDHNHGWIDGVGAGAHSVERGIVQLAIQRDQRMVGIEMHVYWDSPKWVPEIVHARLRFWTSRFDLTDVSSPPPQSCTPAPKVVRLLPRLYASEVAFADRPACLCLL